MRELARAAGLASTSSVYYQLQRLREQGVVVENRGRRSARCPTADADRRPGSTCG
ncbi:hypothetical protein ACIG3E_23600 [Streptomyces sp. NPDC053474]|uniref:LexA family protein n=1 Tax=Streptomyces sp. NPDC053474 TaxID=3365704 RepID=UPI0037D30C8D